MKTFFRITLIFVLTATTGLMADVREVKSDPNTVAETETRNESFLIPASLPAIATVTLQDDDTKSGQVVDMNSEYLTIKRGNSRSAVLIATIARVEFETNSEVWWPDATGAIVIRGDDTGKEGKPVPLQVRMDGFEWVEKEKGIANILSEAVVDVNGQGRRLRGIRGVVKSGKIRYVVSEIKFDVENQLLTITATATSRQE